jgi:hypothetical protein
MNEAKGLEHGKRQAEEGLSGNLQPEIPVRHTIGSEINATDREPLCINIAPHGGRLQALILAPPPLSHRLSHLRPHLAFGRPTGC